MVFSFISSKKSPARFFIQILSLSIILSLFSACQTASSEKLGDIPADGEYTYTVAFAEFSGKSMGSTCKVSIKGNSITAYSDGSIPGTKKGEVISKGTITQHTATGRWIIAENESDIHANEIGGCTDGPLEIDLKKKKLWLC